MKTPSLPILLFTAMLSAAAAADPGPMVLPLWEDRLLERGGEALAADGSASQVSHPEISVYLRERKAPLSPALVVCAGGSYLRVGRYTTGMGIVDYFRPRGFAVIVLKYRTTPPSRDFSDALEDAQRAMRLVRHHARAWGIDPTRIGMVGSSAGAHLILSTIAHADRGRPDAADPIERQSCAPDFVGLLCPWPAGQSMEALSPAAGAPPAFVCSALDDTVAPTAFARDIVSSYRKVGSSAELWTVAQGGHRAFTIGGRGEGARWVEHFQTWLRLQGFIP